MLVLLFIVTTIGFMFSFYKRSGMSKYIYIIILFAISLVTAFQDNYGIDYLSYIQIYEGERGIPSNFGKISTLIILFFRSMEFSSRSFFIFFGVLMGLMLFYDIKLLKINRIISDEIVYLMLLIYTGTFYLETFNTIRTTIGSLFFVGVCFNFKDNITEKLKKIMLFCIGIGIHPAILAVFPFLVLKTLLSKKINTVILYLGLISCFILKGLQLIKIIANYIYINFPNFMYRHYLVSEYLYTGIRGTNIIVTMQFLLILLSLKFYAKEQNEKKIYILNLVYIVFCAKYIFFGSLIFERFIFLFSFIIPYVYYYLNDNIKNNNYGIVIIKIMIFILYILIFWLHFK